MVQLIEFTEYRPYLRRALKEGGKAVRGIQSRYAEAISCRPGYVSQILHGDTDLSPDQASLTSAFFSHTTDEAQMFLLMVLYARAGTQQLKAHLQKQLQELRDRHLNVQERLKVKSNLSETEQMLIYSSWHYLAILSLISIPDYARLDRIAKHLRLPEKVVSEALEVLQKLGLVIIEDGKYKIGQRRTFLPKNSPMAGKHHANWRLQALQSIERQQEEALHYTTVLTFSEKDRELIKSVLVNAIESVSKIVVPSKEERLHCLNIDFFDV